MWVLAPLPGLNAASQAGEAQPHHQTIYLTASGEISIGRPLKKGSTVGKADILIFNEQSVSSIHANLHAGAGSTQQDGSFTHGSLSITGRWICTAQAPRCIHTLLSQRRPTAAAAADADRHCDSLSSISQSIRQSVSHTVCLPQLLAAADVSRFGTFLTRDGDAEQKLITKTPVELQDGDTLKFGSHTRCASLSVGQPVTGPACHWAVLLQTLEDRGL